MKAIIDFDSYDSQLNPIIYTFNPWLIGASVIGASVYTFIADSMTNIDGSTNYEFMATLFFRAMLTWAAIYMLKKMWLNNIIKRAYDTQGITDNYYFLPCFYNTGIYNTNFGNIFIDGRKLYFQSNRVSKDPVLFKCQFENIEISTTYEANNILCRIFWGDPKVLIVRDTATNKIAKFLAPDPEACKTALEDLIHQLDEEDTSQ